MDIGGPDLSAVPVIQLEALRLRLTQLVHSLNKLQGQVQHATLPSWPMLQSQLGVILTQLTALSVTLAGSAENLQRTVSYPLGEFPTAQQAGLLTTLLRKKNLPEVQEWIEEGTQAAGTLKVKQDEDFCSWAVNAVGNEVSKHEWTGFLTREDIDHGEADLGIAKQTEQVEAPENLTLGEILGYMSRVEVPPRFIRGNNNLNPNLM